MVLLGLSAPSQDDGLRGRQWTLINLRHMEQVSLWFFSFFSVLSPSMLKTIWFCVGPNTISCPPPAGFLFGAVPQVEAVDLMRLVYCKEESVTLLVIVLVLLVVLKVSGGYNNIV